MLEKATPRRCFFHLIKNIRLSSFPNQMRPNSTNLQRNQCRHCIKKTFECMNISRKCKFTGSNCVILDSFQIEFKKYKYLQKMNILETKKTFKYAHFQNLIIYTSIHTKMKKLFFSTLLFYFDFLIFLKLLQIPKYNFK